MLTIEKQCAEDAIVLRISGDVDEEGVKQLRVALVDCLRQEVYNVVLNMEGMRFISYMGVGVLVERLRQFRANDGDMTLVSPNMYTLRLFRMTGVTNLFEVYETEHDALSVLEEAA